MNILDRMIELANLTLDTKKGLPVEQKEIIENCLKEANTTRHLGVEKAKQLYETLVSTGAIG